MLVDFYADWCGPCKRMTPVLHEVKQAMGDDIVVIKVDVDKNNHLATRYGIQSIPTLIVFKNGQEKWRRSGLLQANELQTLMQPFVQTN